MTEPTQSDSGLSRRQFGAIALGGAGAVAVGGLTVFQLLGSAPGQAIRRFDVRHDPSVYVTMTNGTEFVVEVKERGSRRVLERHDPCRKPDAAKQ